MLTYLAQRRIIIESLRACGKITFECCIYKCIYTHTRALTNTHWKTWEWEKRQEVYSSSFYPFHPAQCAPLLSHIFLSGAKDSRDLLSITFNVCVCLLMLVNHIYRGLSLKPLVTMHNARILLIKAYVRLSLQGFTIITHTHCMRMSLDLSI